MNEQGMLEVRMLGRFQVVRPDRTEVGPSEWRTGKTADVLRLLALRPGLPVSTRSLAERVWPQVDDRRALASLRTAAYQIRRAIGFNCIDRRFGTITLPTAWTDVVVYQRLGGAVRDACSAGNLERAVELVEQSERLYVGDFSAHDDTSDWAVDLRESLASLRGLVLADGASSAVRLRRPRQAISFALRAIERDPCAEAPHRSLLEGYAQLGEVDRALRAYEHCRSTLARELGADPSPSTQALHLRVLRGEVGPTV